MQGSDSVPFSRNYEHHSKAKLTIGLVVRYDPGLNIFSITNISQTKLQANMKCCLYPGLKFLFSCDEQF